MSSTPPLPSQPGDGERRHITPPQRSVVRSPQRHGALSAAAVAAEVAGFGPFGPFVGLSPDKRSAQRFTNSPESGSIPIPVVPRDAVRATHFYDPKVNAAFGLTPPGDSLAPVGVSADATAAAVAAVPIAASPNGVPRSPGNAKYDIKLVTGNANLSLAHDVSDLLGKPLSACGVSARPDGEIKVYIGDNQMGHDVYVLQPTCASGSSEGCIDVNDALLELLFMVRRLKLSRAERITAVIPFFAYARQDRKTALRGPISACAVAQMVVTAGVDRVITMDLHSGQIQGFFGNIPLDNLQFSHEFATHIRKLPWFDPRNTVMVSPDAGGVDRARKLADILCIDKIVTILKRRVQAGQVESMQTVGDVAGLNCIIVDDMVDTGGTLVKGCCLLKDLGALRVIACCTHAIMSESCCSLVSSCDALESLVVSDSIPQDEHEAKCSKLVVLPSAPLLAASIHRHHAEESISSLFNGPTSPPHRLEASTMGRSFLNLKRESVVRPGSRDVTPATLSGGLDGNFPAFPS